MKATRPRIAGAVPPRNDGFQQEVNTFYPIEGSKVMEFWEIFSINSNKLPKPFGSDIFVGRLPGQIGIIRSRG
jgi:hypothetical protein